MWADLSFYITISFLVEHNDPQSKVMAWMNNKSTHTLADHILD